MNYLNYRLFKHGTSRIKTFGNAQSGLRLDGDFSVTSDGLTVLNTNEWNYYIWNSAPENIDHITIPKEHVEVVRFVGIVIDITNKQIFGFATANENFTQIDFDRPEVEAKYYGNQAAVAFFDYSGYNTTYKKTTREEGGKFLYNAEVFLTNFCNRRSPDRSGSTYSVFAFIANNVVTIKMMPMADMWQSEKKPPEFVRISNWAIANPTLTNAPNDAYEITIEGTSLSQDGGVAITGDATPKTRYFPKGAPRQVTAYANNDALIWQDVSPIYSGTAGNGSGDNSGDITIINNGGKEVYAAV